jgi:serine/threonine-protein kinase
MLTNRLPFEGDSAVSVAIQHLSSIPLAPREIDPDIPEPLELICMKAMAPDRDRRYDSAEAMIADLDAFRKNPGVDLDIDPMELHPDEPDEPTRLLHAGAVATAQQRHPSRETPRERESGRDYDRAHSRKPARQMSPKKRTAVIAGAVVLALVAVFFLARAVFNSVAAGDTYTVPNVLGCTEEKANQLPEVAGIFTIKVVGSDYSDAPEGEIIKQDPVKGMPLKTDLVINVTISAGERTGTMLNLTGQTAQAAKVSMKSLKNDLNLTIDTKEESNDDVTEGCIIRTEPEAGSTLEKGGSVMLVVSTGPEKIPVVVIPFITLTIDQAKEQAKTLGLEVVEKDVDSDEPAGTVVDQDIAENTRVYEGTKITLSVSKGPADTQTPSGDMVTKSVTFSLPQDGRETVHMVVLLNGESAYEGDVDCSQGTIPMDLIGSGTETVQVYYDNELFETRAVNFDA